MTENLNTTNEPTVGKGPTPGWIICVRLLLSVAIVGAGYLAWVAFHNGPVAGCGPQSGCDKVLHSPWAYWMDVPVSVPALLVYLALLGMTYVLLKRPGPDDERGSWAAIIVLAVAVAGAALWFVGLQVFVLKAFCKFCMTAHTCGLVAALICLSRVPRAEDPTTPMWASGSGKRGVPRAGLLQLTLIGLFGVAVLAGVQVLSPRKLNVVKDFRPPANQTAPGTNYWAAAAALAAQIPEYSSPLPRFTGPRELSLYGTAFVFKLDAVPMIGSPDASNVIVSLFDYNCKHCRQLHPILTETQRQFSNQLGVVCLPMPLSTNCNKLLPAGTHSGSNACEYARLVLAVYRAKPEAFRQFDDWMFTGERPPAYEQAQARAAQLVGADKLQAALTDAWVREQIALDCRLHSTNWATSGEASLPQLVIADTISSGQLNSIQHLMIMLNRYLGLTPPPGNGL